MTTRDQIKDFLPLLTDEDLDTLVMAANADADEGPEWLPFYKMSLARLAECVGTLCAIIDGIGNLNPRQRALLHDAGRLFKHHLLFAGAGCEKDPKRIREVEALAAKAFFEFMEM